MLRVLAHDTNEPSICRDSHCGVTRVPPYKRDSQLRCKYPKPSCAFPFRNQPNPGGRFHRARDFFDFKACVEESVNYGFKDLAPDCTLETFRMRVECFRDGIVTYRFSAIETWCGCE